MPMIQPDLTEVGPVEPGTYPAEIKSVEVKTARSSGAPMLEVSFDVQVGDNSRTRTSYVMLSGKGAFGFYALLQATGFGDLADRFAKGEKDPFDTDSLVGQHVHVVVEQEEFEGQMRDRIKTYLKA